MFNEKEYIILQKAIYLAFEAHKDQVRRMGNTPYIFHPLAVMHEMDTMREKTVAILHDVIEDHPEFYEQVINLISHDAEMYQAILQLTKSKQRITYDKYIDIMIQHKNPITIKVKIADLKHNLSTIEVFGKHLKGKYETKYRQSLKKLQDHHY